MKENVLFYLAIIETTIIVTVSRGLIGEGLVSLAGLISWLGNILQSTCY